MSKQVNTGTTIIPPFTAPEGLAKELTPQPAATVLDREASGDPGSRRRVRGLLRFPRAWFSKGAGEPAPAGRRGAAPKHTLGIAIGLAEMLIGLLPGTVGAQTVPIHIPFDAAGQTDLCGVSVSYESHGLFTLVYNPVTNTVTAVSHGYTALTGPNGKTLIDRTGDLQLITNVVNADGSQSYTWTLPARATIKLEHGGVLLLQAGITKLTATVYPDGSFISAVTLDKGPRMDPTGFCDVVIAALTS